VKNARNVAGLRSGFLNTAASAGHTFYRSIFGRINPIFLFTGVGFITYLCASKLRNDYQNFMIKEGKSRIVEGALKRNDC